MKKEVYTKQEQQLLMQDVKPIEMTNPKLLVILQSIAFESAMHLNFWNGYDNSNYKLDTIYRDYLSFVHRCQKATTKEEIEYHQFYRPAYFDIQHFWEDSDRYHKHLFQFNKDSNLYRNLLDAYDIEPDDENVTSKLLSNFSSGIEDGNLIYFEVCDEEGLNFEDLKFSALFGLSMAMSIFQ